MPKEKKSACVSDPVGQRAGARELDHRAHGVVLAGGACPPLPAASSTMSAHELELELIVDERDHDLDAGRRSPSEPGPLGAARDDRHDLLRGGCGARGSPAGPRASPASDGLLELAHALERVLELREVVGALDPGPLDLCGRRRATPGGSRPAADPAGGSSPADPPSPRRSPRSPPAGAAELLQSRRGGAGRCRRGSAAPSSAGARRGRCARCGTARCPRPRTRAPSRVLGGVGVGPHAQVGSGRRPTRARCGTRR